MFPVEKVGLANAGTVAMPDLASSVRRLAVPDARAIRDSYYYSRFRWVLKRGEHTDKGV